jgi:hypothetical protein
MQLWEFREFWVDTIPTYTQASVCVSFKQLETDDVEFNLIFVLFRLRAMILLFWIDKIVGRYLKFTGVNRNGLGLHHFFRVTWIV